MTLRELIDNIARIKELQDSGVEPDPRKYGAPGELANLLAIELKEIVYEED